MLHKYYNILKLKITVILLSAIISLLLFKGLFLLVSVLNTVLLGLSESKGELAFSYVGMVLFLLPGEIVLIFLIVFLAFRSSMKQSLNWYQISGFMLSVIIVLYFGDFFFGSVGTFSVTSNLIVGYVLIAAGMLGLKKILNKIVISSDVN